MTITSEQAVKLRELLRADRKARSAVHNTVYLSEDHWERLREYAEQSVALETYITSLTDKSNEPPTPHSSGS